MKPVFQDTFGHGQGNCAWACVASLFELSLPEAQQHFGPPDFQDLREWTKLFRPELEYKYIDLGYDYEIVDGFPDCEGVGTGRWTYKIAADWEPPDASLTDGYWLATVPSQKLVRPVSDPYYPMAALHMVVMRDRVCVHDPNPNNDLIRHPQVIDLHWWETGESI